MPARFVLPNRKPIKPGEKFDFLKHEDRRSGKDRRKGKEVFAGKGNSNYSLDDEFVTTRMPGSVIGTFKPNRRSGKERRKNTVLSGMVAQRISRNILEDSLQQNFGRKIAKRKRMRSQRQSSEAIRSTALIREGVSGK